MVIKEMDDGDEENARVPNNLLIGLDELPSWHDGGLSHFLPLGVSSLPLEPGLSVLPSVGSMGKSRTTTNL